MSAADTAQPHFVVDRKGLAAIIRRRPDWLASVVHELYQNAVDCSGVTEVQIGIYMVPGRPQIIVRVTDNHPDGFSDLSHAWTLFARSEKRADPDRRGRFNLGEKLVAAVCEWMSIDTTTGSVLFNDDGRRVRRGKRREAGSQVEVCIRAPHSSVDELRAAVGRLIPPPGVTVWLHGDAIRPREPVCTFTCSLPTEVEDEEGVMRRRERQTSVRVYEPTSAGATLYEMGIPVVPLDGDRYDIDVGQKVPVSLERDTVSASYVRALRVHLANALADRIGAEDATRPWVRDALGDRRISDVAVRAAITARFGEKVVAYDPSDRESNLTAVSRGYVVIHGAQLSADEWENVRRVGAAPPAGKVAPSPKVYGDGPPTQQVPVEEWTLGMRIVAAYARRLALAFHADSRPIEVAMELAPGAGWAANYGGKRLAFNVPALGEDWFQRAESEIGEEHDDLLLHELGHERGGHLETAYHEALTLYGARLRRVGPVQEAAARAEVLRRRA